MRWKIALTLALVCATVARAELTIVDGNTSTRMDLSAAFEFEPDALPCRVQEVGGLTLLVLGARDANQVHGEQRQWLGEQLAMRKGEPVVVMYNAAAWPAVGNPSDRLTKAVRKAWASLCVEHELPIVLEVTGHTSTKQTIELEGTVYIDPGIPGGQAAEVAEPGSWLSGGRWYLQAASRSPKDVTIHLEDGRVDWLFAGVSRADEPGESFAWAWLLVSGAMGLGVVTLVDGIRQCTSRRAWRTAYRG